MDRIKISNKITMFVRKYKYVALVLLLGVVLMMIPGKSRDSDPAAAAQTVETQAAGDSVRDELAAILSMVKGAGKVEVMLTVASGAETIYQTDDDVASTPDSSSAKNSTVIITDAARVQGGLVRQENPAQYLGVIVVCEGADSPAVRLAIVEAVSDVTGLGADRISVLKMK